MLTFVGGLHVVPADLRIIDAQFAQFCAHPFFLFILTFARQHLRNDVVIDEVLNQLAQLNVIKLVMKQRVVDEQAIHALQFANHLT